MDNGKKCEFGIGDTLMFSISMMRRQRKGKSNAESYGRDCKVLFISNAFGQVHSNYLFYNIEDRQMSMFAIVMIKAKRISMLLTEKKHKGYGRW